MARRKHAVETPPRPCLRVLLGAVVALGPGKADLLEALRDTGSISAAARRMRMSYARAWQLVDTMNQSFREPLVVLSRGGSQGGGAVLTPFGEMVLGRYRAMESKTQHVLADDLAEFQGWLVPPS